jgi:hypothetical protein
MDRELGKDIEAGARRIDFLESNCDKVEEKGYMKRYTPRRNGANERTTIRNGYRN